jgi:predicted  nucleic acid-binding Zn-ribbon protein
MRVRHRIPSIFNLSMVDVLCCALGCVILLWLINLREAKHHEDTAAEHDREVTALLDSTRAERDSAYDLVARLGSQMTALEDEKDSLQKRLDSLRAEAEGVSKNLRASEERVAALTKDLRDRTRRHEAETARAGDLERRLKEATDRGLALEKEMARRLDAAGRRQGELQADLKAEKARYATEEAMARALEKEIAKHLDELKGVRKSLESVQAARRTLERDLDARDRDLAAARPYKEKWATADERVRSLEKDLADRRRELADAAHGMAALQGEKKALQAEAARVRAAADNRFAGIELTGRRVLFLVDMSGSMDLVDEQTRAPHKWEEVRSTVARLMRSMPDLEKYQVILFAEKAAFLFAGEEDWLTYDARTSPARVLKGLAAIKPLGGTNMYAALEAAFRLRPKGLDTIYLLSDGLPNMGEGLTLEESARLKEVERSDILARYIRKALKESWNLARPGQPRVRINTVGFFYESPDVGAFLWALARENDGSFVGMSKP